MALEIAAAIDSFTADDTARVMVVTGTGERSRVSRICVAGAAAQYSSTCHIWGCGGAEWV